MPKVSAASLLREIEEAPASGPPMQQRRFREAIELIKTEELIEAVYSWRFVELDAPPGETLRAGGEAIYAPKLLPESGELTALACGVATIGARAEQRIGALFAERRMSLALALDAAANRLVFAVSRRLQDRMLVAARKQGLTMAGELRPGDPGLALQTQAAVVRLADGGSIGVHVSDGQTLRPLKSISMVLGVGIDLPAVHWSRCDECRSRSSCKHAGLAQAASP